MVAVGEHLCLNPREGEIEEVHHIAAHQVGEESLILRAGNEESLQESVGHVADDAGGDERPGHAQRAGGEESLAEQTVEPHQRHYLHAEEDEGRPHGAMPCAEGHAGVVYAHEAEVHELASPDYGYNHTAIAVSPVVGEVEHHGPLGGLVEGVECDDEDDEPDGNAAGHGGRNQDKDRRAS